MINQNEVKENAKRLARRAAATRRKMKIFRECAAELQIYIEAYEATPRGRPYHIVCLSNAIKEAASKLGRIEP